MTSRSVPAPCTRKHSFAFLVRNLIASRTCSRAAGPPTAATAKIPTASTSTIQLQVILKPSPANIQDLYLESIRAIGIKLAEHDIRFEEDNWESPTLGAWGIGWQVLLDGLEITQFTYFQQCGGIDLDPVSVELTYGLDRIAAYLQNVDNVFDVRWSRNRTYGEVRLAEEQQFSAYSFDYADPETTRKLFDLHEREANALLEAYAHADEEAEEALSSPGRLRPVPEMLALI